jgi:hypothetical protein
VGLGVAVHDGGYPSEAMTAAMATLETVSGDAMQGVESGTRRR